MASYSSVLKQSQPLPPSLAQPAEQAAASSPRTAPVQPSDDDAAAAAAAAAASAVANTMAVTTKTLVRKNRRGNVVKIAREHYLRNDIPCHWEGCRSAVCGRRQPNTPSSSLPVIDAVRPLLSIDAAHIVLPDVQAVEDYLDLFEQPELRNVVFCQTCISHIRSKGTSKAYTRLKAVFSDPRTSCVAFANENNVHCFAPRALPHESVDMYESKLVLNAARWYSQHTGGKIPVLVIADSPQQMPQAAPASTADIQVLSMQEYLQTHHPLATHLHDMYFSLRSALDEKALELEAQLQPDRTSTAGSVPTPSALNFPSLLSAVLSYPPHISQEDAENGVQAGRVVQGLLQVSKANYQFEALVKCSGAGAAVAFTKSKSQSAAASGTVTSRPTGPPEADAAGDLDVAALELANVGNDEDGKGLTLDDVCVLGMRDRNRGVHGDLVAVQLLPESQWLTPDFFAALMKALRARDTEALAVLGSRFHSGEFQRTSTSPVRIPLGRVVHVFQRNWRDFVCTLQADSLLSSAAQASSTIAGTLATSAVSSQVTKVIAIPMDPRIPKIRIATRQAASLRDDRIVIRIDQWETSSQYPFGHLVRSLGRVDDVDAETAAILVEHGIVLNPISENQLKELPIHTPEAPWQIPSEELQLRRDIRSQLVFSIDPLGSKDVDDALSARALSPEEQARWMKTRSPASSSAFRSDLSAKPPKFEFGVHIADVSYFVREGTLTDIEARSRSTTVYLADRRFDMLPAVLSEELCSLLSCQDRCAMSVLWLLDEAFNVVDVWFGRTFLRSAYQLHYELAQEIATLARPDDEFVKLVRELNAASIPVAEKRRRLEEMRAAIQLLMAISRKFRKDRSAQGALELESSEIRFKFDERNNITEVVPKKELEIHKSVAEAMILANYYVGKQIATAFPTHALLRRHPLPRKANLEKLIAVAKASGFEMDVSSNKSIAESLDKCIDPADPQVNKMIRTLATQAMSEAAYVSTGDVLTAELYHYGLALEFYTHFTSPIRRYADVYVHRQLMASLRPDSERSEKSRSGKGMLSNAELAQLCSHINTKHRMSKLAQEASTEMFQSLFFQARLEETAASHPAQGDEDEVEAKSKVVADGIIFALKSTSLSVYVPDYGVKSSVALADSNGVVQLPLRFVHEVERRAGATLPPPTASSEFVRGGSIDAQSNQLVVHLSTLGKSFPFRLFDHVTVQVALQRSRAHRHTVKLHLVGPPMASAPRGKSAKSGPGTPGPAGLAKRAAMQTASARGGVDGQGIAAHRSTADGTLQEGSKFKAPKLAQEKDTRDAKASFKQAPDTESFYLLMERLRELSLVDEELDFSDDAIFV